MILSKCIQPHHSFAQTPLMVSYNMKNNPNFLPWPSSSLVPSNLSHSRLLTVPSPVIVALLNHKLTKHASISGQHFCSLHKYSHVFLPYCLQISAQMSPPQRELQMLLKIIPTSPPSRTLNLTVCVSSVQLPSSD